MANNFLENMRMGKLFEGQPIKPNVDRLIEQLKPNTGDVFQHEDIAHVAGVTYPSGRYRSLIASWRSRLSRELNIDIAPVSGVGYRVLDDNERVAYGIKDYGHSVRRMGRSANRIATAVTAKLDDNHRRQQDHAVRLTQELVQSARKVSKQIGIAGRVVTLPRAAQS
jgi:hypothetical protein